MSKVCKKMFAIFCLILILFSIFSEYAFSSDGSSGVSIDPKNFNGKINGTGATRAISSGRRIIAGILNAVRTVGVAIAVVMLIVIACKYMMASAGDRADVKKYIPTYVIGAIVLFAASGIVSIIRNYVNDSF